MPSITDTWLSSTCLLAGSTIPFHRHSSAAFLFLCGMIAHTSSHFLSHRTDQYSFFNSGTQFLVKAIMLRISLVVATLSHEIAHLLAAAATRKHPIQDIFTISNILGNVPLRRWIFATSPLAAWPCFEDNPHIILPSEAAGLHFTLIRLAGPIFSVLLALFMTSQVWETGNDIDFMISWGLWLVALGGMWSDVLSMHCKGRSASFQCGNFGMLLICAMDRYAIQIPEVLREMASITAARGGQAGGLVTLLPNGSAYRCRYLPSKRADVAKGLINRFFSGLYFRRMFSRVKSEECRLFLGHTRFATSSKPSVSESHPHRFSAPKKVTIWRRQEGGWTTHTENFELFVTHNGDFDYWSQFDRVLTHREVGTWLQKVLKMSHEIAQCDSVKVAGVLELLRTQGIWEHSLRLAFYQVVAVLGQQVLPDPPDVHGAICAAASIADAAFKTFTQSKDITSPDDVDAFTQVLCEKLLAVKETLDIPHVLSSVELIDAFSARATANFFENDLFASTLAFLRDAQGSFGLTVCCTVDRNKVCIASRGQTMSVSFNANGGVVLWGSETCTQSVGIPQARLPSILKNARQDVDDEESGSRMRPDSMRCTHRHDLDEDGGEIMEIAICSHAEDRIVEEAPMKASMAAYGLVSGISPVLTADSRVSSRFQPFSSASIYLRVYKQNEDRMIPREVFMNKESLISLDSDMIDVPPPSNLSDRVASDIVDIPRILGVIRKDWKDVKGYNQQTASALFKMIRDQVNQRLNDPGGRLEVDVLITGVEASLWIGEQFASDLQTLLPALRVVTISSNKIVGVLSNIRGSAPMAGFAFSSLTLSLQRAIVIAISHSGQTFPTLRATHALRKVCGDRLFVVTGSIDSKMSTAVGQFSYPDAPWVGRVLCTFAGWRPSEALTVSTVACHHTLSELLMYLANACSREEALFSKAASFKMVPSDVSDLSRLNDSLVYLAAPNIVGIDRKGAKIENAKAGELRAQGRRWALHILETPHAWCLSTAYIFATIISGKPLFAAIRDNIFRYNQPDGGQDALQYITLILDALLYSFLPLVFSLILRIVQGRPLMARLGKRTIVIGDIPYVHQLLESYVSKLFSLSYSIASVDVHGANAVDHLVHRFTHRVVRGLLIAVGRPDGRLFSLVKMESWVLMALQQCKAIVHLLSPPEILTVGHNLYVNHQVIDCHVTLQKKRPDFFCEVMSEVQETEPMVRSASYRCVARDSNIEVELLKQGTKPLCSYSKENIRNCKQDLMLASRLKAWYGQSAGVADPEDIAGGSDARKAEQRKLVDMSNHGSVHGMLGFISEAEKRFFDTSIRSAIPDTSGKGHGVNDAGGAVSSMKDGGSAVYDTSIRGQGFKRAASAGVTWTGGDSGVFDTSVRSQGFKREGSAEFDASMRNQGIKDGGSAVFEKSNGNHVTKNAGSAALSLKDAGSGVFDTSIRNQGIFQRAGSTEFSLKGAGSAVFDTSIRSQVMMNTSMRNAVFDTRNAAGRMDTSNHFNGSFRSFEAGGVGNGYADGWVPAERFSGNLMEILNRGSAVELWYENRYASLERYMAFLVMFHAMAARVASFHPLAFDVARSQSQLRVATTAAPISATDLEKEWAAGGGLARVPSSENRGQYVLDRPE